MTNGMTSSPTVSGVWPIRLRARDFYEVIVDQMNQLSPHKNLIVLAEL